MKIYLSVFFLLSLLSFNIYSRDVGQTEITTEEGIEVFQNEKYYLLKKNVIIESDSFELSADNVKANFEKDLYDITKIESNGNVILKSSQGLYAEGDKIIFSTKNEDIQVFGLTSTLIYNNINMSSNKLIDVDNSKGSFNLEGEKSELKTDEIHIFGDIINGTFTTINEVNEIDYLYVEDNEEANIVTSSMNLFALKAKYNKKENIIELFENVKVIRGAEIITGDYANIDTLNETYKIKSNKKQKVKALISNTDE